MRLSLANSVVLALRYKQTFDLLVMCTSVDVVTDDDVLRVLQTHPLALFLEVRDVLRELRGGRRLTTDESKTIQVVLTSWRAERVAKERSEREEIPRTDPESVMICTAYSEDYTIGRLCEFVNRGYAARHGYRFESVELPYKDMLAAVSPRQHVTWFKCLLIRQLLARARDSHVTWIMWIDSDAVVIAPGTRVLEDIVPLAGGRELIVAEDMHAGCLLNAGVLLVRVSDWSSTLWEDVWLDRKYWSVPFYEQAALIGALKARQEGLELVRPFHSHVRCGPKGPKLFAHVCVLPSLDFNTNIFRCDPANAQPAEGIEGSGEAQTQDGTFESARFIFHAAGTAEGGKLATLRRVLAACKIDVPESSMPDSMHIFRGSHGRPPKPDRVAARSAAFARDIHSALPATGSGVGGVASGASDAELTRLTD